MNLAAYFQGRDASQDATVPMPWVVPGAIRADLPAYFHDLGFTTGVEVGVWEGVYAEQLCHANPSLHLTCVDSWTQYAAYNQRFKYRHPIEEGGGSVMGDAAFQSAYEAAERRLRPYGCTLMREDSLRAAARLPDGSLDFVYLDGNHQFEYVVADLAAWMPKIRVGGVMAGHDYLVERQIDVVAAVDGWTVSHAVRPWFVLGRTHRRKREPGEKYRSWLWTVRDKKG